MGLISPEVLCILDCEPLHCLGHDSCLGTRLRKAHYSSAVLDGSQMKMRPLITMLNSHFVYVLGLLGNITFSAGRPEPDQFSQEVLTIDELR